jgi:kynurenine 3-monooxygenase
MNDTNNAINDGSQSDSKISSKPEHIVIAGSGLVGSLLAVMLAKKGYQITMYESRPDMRRQDISAGKSINLALANRGIKPLEDAGVMDLVKPNLISMTGRMIHDELGQTHLQAYGQQDHEVIYSVSRGDLNKILMTEAEKTGNVTIQFSHEITEVDFDSDSLTIRNRDDDSTFSTDFDTIIGADGAHSPVRQAILAAHQSEAHPELQNSREPLDHGYKELCIPAGENSSFQMEKEALHIWPRGQFMLIALPNPDASFTVTLFMPNQGGVSFESLDNHDKVNAFFSQYFKDALDLIPNLAESFFENPVGALATVRAQPWTYDHRAIILGDAAHAIVPFHGQGMNCGFEDCREFLNLLEQSDHDWNQLYQQFEKARKPNADAIADMALDNYIEMRHSVRDPLYLMKKELGFKLEQRWPNRFIPRYSMVMFNLMPYADAQSRGVIQNDIMEQLLAGKDSVEEVDFELAEALISEQLSALG